MSLFPAYSHEESDNSEESDRKVGPGPSWLSNSTFQAPEEIRRSLDQTSSSCSEEDTSKRKFRSSDSSDSDGESREYTKSASKRRKSRKDIKGKRKTNDVANAGLFYEDSTALDIPDHQERIPQVKRTKPPSNYSNAQQQEKKKKKKKKKKSDKSRYFSKKTDEEVLAVSSHQPMELAEFLKQTEMFNKTLRNEPHDINTWLNYLKLQDAGVGNIKSINEKKLSILDKALEANPDSDRLLQQKMIIAETIYPMDKVGMEAKSIVAKFPKNLTGWLWMLNSSQYNLSKMTAPGVLLTYEKVLEGVHKAHKESEPFLDFLFLCGLFLRQCGLWEQLLILIELYLELTLSTAGSGLFNIKIELPHDRITELEDSIIRSGLPLEALWLRVERLREGVHFAPVAESEDPQRVVFREDLTPLLFPLPKSASSRLVINTLLLLKVPPLPLTDSFYAFTNLNNTSWSLDSVEFILAAKFSTGESSYLDIVPQLLHGPQYLIDNLGRTEYFEFVNTVFDKTIANCPKDNICFRVWQMRWWRWVYSFQEENESSKKYYLGLSKKVLKDERDSVPLYIEYALLLNKCGDFDNCAKVLETTIGLKGPPLLAGLMYKRDLYYLYRIYVELHVKKNLDLYRDKILRALMALAFGDSVKNIPSCTSGLILKCKERFQHMTTEVLLDIVPSDNCEVTLSEVMTPDFRVSWLTCHSWFLFITQGPRESINFFTETITHIEEKTNICRPTGFSVIIEGLYEGLIEICKHHCESNPGNNAELIQLSERALKTFPNNAFFLNTIYSCKLSGLRWNTFCGNIYSVESALASTIVYLMTHDRLVTEESLKATAPNRLLALLEKLKDTFNRCPLIWRLVIQASALRDSEQIKNTFYQSLEKCPWVKVLYYEAGKILPGDLAEIQDLLIEKELRLHITPEELEILRQDT